MEIGDKGKIQRRGRHAEKSCSLDVTKLLARNSQQLWLPVQELHRVRPSTISSEMREVDALIPSEEPLAVDGCWQQGFHFSSAV